MDVSSVLTFKDLLINLTFIFRGNRDFFQLLNEFQKKLPPSNKRAVEIKNESYYTALDLSKFKTHLTTADIDMFQKSLETFNYNTILFRRKRVTEFANNLIRLLKSSNQKLSLAMIQSILEDANMSSSKPYLINAKVGKYLGF